MNFSVMKSAVQTWGRRTAIKISEKSPAICLGVGVTLVTVAAVDACRRTSKAQAIIEAHKKNMEPIVEGQKNGEIQGTPYSKKDAVKDKLLTYGQTGLEFAKLYGPDIFMYGLGIYSILTSHRIMMRRQAALAASYAALHKSYNDYRKKVSDKYGEDFDKIAANNLGTAEIEYTDENGEIKKKKAKNVVLDEHGLSPYTFLIAPETSTEYTPNGLYNITQCETVISYYRERFEHLVVIDAPDVLKSLGVWGRMKEEDQMKFVGMGWVWDPDNPTQTIMASYYDAYRNKYPNPGEGSIVMTDPVVLVELNVQGNVSDLFRDIYSRKKLYARRRGKAAQIETEVEEA